MVSTKFIENVRLPPINAGLRILPGRQFFVATLLQRSMAVINELVQCVFYGLAFTASILLSVLGITQTIVSFIIVADGE